jgi:hypothetical protein
LLGVSGHGGGGYFYIPLASSSNVQRAHGLRLEVRREEYDGRSLNSNRYNIDR